MPLDWAVQVSLFAGVIMLCPWTNTHSAASLWPDEQMSTGKINTGGNPVID